MSDESLALVLRCIGVFAMFALVPAAMPFSWMIAVHRWLGLGEMPTAPVVEYLARSASISYALFGAVCLFLARDVDHYRHLLAFIGILIALTGIAFTGIDFGSGMPWWWSALEGPPTVAGGLCFFWWARRNS